MGLSKSGFDFKDYIFLNYFNYLKQPWVNNQPTYHLIKYEKKIKEQYFKEKQINYDNKQNLEQALNSLFAPNGQSAFSGNIGLSKEAAEYVFNIIETYLDQHYAGARFSKDNLQAYTNKWHKEIESAKIQDKFNKINTLANNRFSFIEEKIKTLSTLLTYINFNHPSAGTEIKNVIKQWKAITNVIGSGDKMIIKTKKQLDVKYKGLSQDFLNFRQAYNNLIDSFYVNSQEITGKIGELAVAAVDYVLKYGITSTVDTAIKTIVSSTLVGDVKTYKGRDDLFIATSQKNIYSSILEPFAALNSNISFSPFTKLNQEAAFMRNKQLIRKQPAGFAFNAIATDDKVDVNFEFGNEEIKASVKNYSLDYLGDKGKPWLNNMKLLSGAHLEDLIAKDKQIVRHYLNITANHSPSFNLQGPLELAHETMKYLIVARAAAGGGSRTKTTRYSPVKWQDQANVMIVNNNSGTTGQFSVLYMSDVINAALDSINSINIKGYPENNKFQHDIGNWRNEPWSWYYGRPRILRIYRQMHAMNISVSIPKEIISNLINKQKT